MHLMLKTFIKLSAENLPLVLNLVCSFDLLHCLTAVKYDENFKSVVFM